MPEVRAIRTYAPFVPTNGALPRALADLTSTRGVMLLFHRSIILQEWRVFLFEKAKSFLRNIRALLRNFEMQSLRYISACTLLNSTHL